jgi:hypothetical protein
MRIPSIVITTGLIGLGVFAWIFAGRPLLADPDLKPPLNPFGINRSPYGEVFAMAMQGPIETNFIVGLFGRETAAVTEPERQIPEPQPVKQPSRSIQVSPSYHLRKMLAIMEKAANERTNPKPASEALKFYLRRQAEDKLRFAYQLDPSHYANYASLHFFLIEGITTHPELTHTAGKLAEETIEYCLKQENDPRPALTAAAACTNILHLMFTDRNKSESPTFTNAQMRHYLNLLDYCLARYNTIATQWDESKNWDLLSNQRIIECEDRFRFISRIRDSAEKTILRFEGKTQISQ